MGGGGGQVAADAGSPPDPATTATRAVTTTASTPTTATEPGIRDHLRQARSRLDLVLVVIMLGAATLRFWNLGGQSLWYDEWLTTEAVSGGLIDVFRHVADREGIPPTYFVLLWGWVRAFGESEAALRVPSALAGVATVPVAYAIAGELGQRRAVARVAALLLAVHPMFVWYSQEARPYSLVALVAALSLLAFARAWQRGRRADLVVWAAAAAAAVALHYFAVFLVAVEAAALVVRRFGQQRPWRAELLACLPTIAVLASLAPLAATQHSHAVNRLWISGFPLSERLREAGRSALVGPNPPGTHWWIAVAAVVAGAAALVAVRARPEDRRVAALLATVGGAAVVLPVMAAVVGVEDVVIGRYLVGSLAPLVVAVAVGLTAARPWWIGAAGVVVLVAVSLTAVVAVARDPELQKPDWDTVAAAFEGGDGDRALLLNVHGTVASPLLRYVDGAHRLGDDEEARVEEIDVLFANPTPRPCNFLVGRACAFVFLGAPLPDPLIGRLTLVDRIALDQFTIERYQVDDGSVSITKAHLVPPDQVSGALVLVSPDPARRS